ncbi:MAG: hypothetical protein QOE92_493 [Chloroflexota bacterium]|jgi:hypothetical protein|nr:hypothetical protein [Chloroflexota bacterium]
MRMDPNSYASSVVVSNSDTYGGDKDQRPRCDPYISCSLQVGRQIL